MACSVDGPHPSTGQGSEQSLSRAHDFHPIWCHLVRPVTCVVSGEIYYMKWWMMTGEHLPSEMIELVQPLADLMPPARVFDKQVYSPWIGGRFHAALTDEQVTTLVVSGGETDVCVLATTLGAIDLGLSGCAAPGCGLAAARTIRTMPPSCFSTTASRSSLTSAPRRSSSASPPNA